MHLIDLLPEEGLAHVVLNGGGLVALREVLGHSSVAVSERYGRLRRTAKTVPVGSPWV